MPANNLGKSGVDYWFNILTNLIAYLGFSFCYLDLVTLGETSIRFRLFAEFDRNRDGLSVSQINSIYDEEAVLLTRLNRYCKSGHIDLVGNRYYLRGKSLLIMAVFLRRIRYLVMLAIRGRHPETLH